jgi:hypothetical protein
MSDEATALNYLRSTLVNPEEPPLLDPDTEQWMIDQGMDENDKRNMRFQFQRHGGQMERYREEVAKDPLTHALNFPNEPMRVRPGESATDYARRRAMGGGATPMGMPSGPLLPPETFNTVPPLEEVTKRSSAFTPPPAAPAAPVVPEQSPDVTSERPHRPIGARFVDGRIVFTNVGIEPGTNVSPEEEAQYGRAVREFRNKADVYQQLHMKEPPEGRISASGVPIPGRHFKVDVNAPLPPEGKFTGETSAVSQPWMANPMEPIKSEDWNDMSPGSRRAFLQEVGEIAITQGKRAEGLLKQAEAMAATDPEFNVKHRMGLYSHFLKEAQISSEVRQTVDAAGDAWLQLPVNKGKSANSPEYRAFLETAEKEAMLAYLKKNYASYAPWDEILSKNIGLTL